MTKNEMVLDLIKRINAAKVQEDTFLFDILREKLDKVVNESSTVELANLESELKSHIPNEEMVLVTTIIMVYRMFDEKTREQQKRI